jgi:hypothetical protein
MLSTSEEDYRKLLKLQLTSKCVQKLVELELDIERVRAYVLTNKLSARDPPDSATISESYSRDENQENKLPTEQVPNRNTAVLQPVLK